MAIDGRLLGRARLVLKNKAEARKAELERRALEVYVKAPRVRELDMQMRETVLELMGIALGAGAQEQDAQGTMESMRKKSTALQKERRSELKKAGFREDYLDEEYMCATCKDTGYAGAKMCSCLEKLYKAEKRKSLSSLFVAGSETFDGFSLSYYDDTPARDTGVSPRENMEIVYKTCVQYAKKFGDKSMNLFLNGATGLGKTYLSACIARVVADKDYSVVYDTAGSIFSKYEELQFSKTKMDKDELTELKDAIKRYIECDLLIIDDLGTEVKSGSTVGALYDVINTRLITGRKTIVNSNLTIEELRLRYSEQIASRLDGEYQVLRFYGEDIRKKRNEV